MRTRLTGAACVLLLAGCSASEPPAADPTASGGNSGPLEGQSETSRGAIGDLSAYDGAISTPVEDSYYPQVGDPLVDALHYDLALTWDKTTLTGHEELTFRATADAGAVQLDLAASLAPTAVSLDGDPVPFDHPGDYLVVNAPVAADSRHVLTLDYAGAPEPVPAPATRKDTETVGLTATPDGRLWTMQEPYGAFTWYAVNDQPSDKSLYDVTVTAPGDWVGISNGELTSRTSDGSTTTTSWSLDSPAASYLTTLAVGPYTSTTATSSSGVPITSWIPSDDVQAHGDLDQVPEMLDWLEAKLGPYPFDTLGFVLVDGESGMETQTMITIGDDDDDLSGEVLVHEMAHQWYGDLVTPAYWRDLWMNEGMATYLQAVWQDEAWGLEPGDTLRDFRRPERRSRKKDGPPGAYDPGRFAAINVYYGPALMWQRLRAMLGDEVFWRLVRDWPAARAGRSTTREDYLGWINQQTGQDLTAFFDAWLMSPTTPKS
ncbi:M1 family metallopeptidase [Nocardioides sp.]|uniref:M1 family metallopeptidase n=1 Tax=Nocardioides sp. TaxID=35761 RepID=UPI0039E67190